MTNTYQSYGKKNNKIKIVTYIDGPFFLNEELTVKEQQKDLRDRVYNTMVERSKNSNIEHIKYMVDHYEYYGHPSDVVNVSLSYICTTSSIVFNNMVVRTRP